MKIYKSSEYGPQGMMAYDLWDDGSVAYDLPYPCGDLLFIDLSLIYISNNPKLKKTLPASNSNLAERKIVISARLTKLPIGI